MNVTEIIQRCDRSAEDSLPGVGVHERGRRPPLGRSSLQDLINFIFVVNRHLLQTLHHHASLQRTTRQSEQTTNKQNDSTAELQVLYELDEVLILPDGQTRHSDGLKRIIWLNKLTDQIQIRCV